MRLVIITNYTDDCTYSYNETIPIEYISPEDFIVDFEKQVRATMKKWPNTFFYLAHHCWDATDYMKGENFISPIILTVDEWYDTITPKNI